MSQNPTSEKDTLILAFKEEQILVMPEGTVTIHIGIINQDVTDDYFDILIKGVPSDWITIDTPVVHLAAGEAKQIILMIHPPALVHSRVGQYPLDVQAVSQSNPQHSVEAHSSLIVAAYQSGGRIGIALGSIYFSVTPGSSVTIPLLLQNQGAKEDIFQLTVEGIPANWISTNAVFTKLEPFKSHEIEFTISVPHSPEAGVGRNPFKIILISQVFPEQKTEAECILTVAAFSKFSVALQPRTLQVDQTGHLTIYNVGNTADTYSVSFRSPGNALMFEKEVVISNTVTQSGAQQIQMGYVEISGDEKIQIDAGAQGFYSFRSRLRSRPFVGEEKAYPFTAHVSSAENMSTELAGEAREKAIITPGVVAALIVIPLLLCLLATIPYLVSFSTAKTAARATQTASFEQTQAAMPVPPGGEQDSDGDGLKDSDEINAGTDSLNPDTDGDGLLDGQEIGISKTNPLVADTDQDGLSDGDEMLKFKTNPLNPDSDGDLLKDGDEIARRTNPLNADTDKDGLSDAVEINLGSDPVQQDSDKDGLVDGEENQTCPNLLTPDSDNDGILDGKDLEPCDANNSLLTATAVAALKTQTVSAATAIPATAVPPTAVPPTAVPPTAVPPTAVPPTNVPPTTAPAPTNTTAALPTNTPVFPTLQGIMVFTSNRDGNPEIYAMNLASQSMLRLTNNAASDMQPALAPDSLHVAYVSNQNGNNEIYLTGLNREPPVNLSNNAADDQQPTWSPDGKQIAFTSNRDGNQEIYIMNSDGSNVHNLTSNPTSDFAPTWFSVPGFLNLGAEEWIVFTSNRDGNQEVYRVRPDGTGLTNLTKNAANDYSPTGMPGGLIAFVTDRDGNPEIYTMTSDGGRASNITNSFSQDFDPAFNADGKWIAFTSDRDGNLEVYVVELAGGRTYNLTRNPAQDGSPDW